MEDASRRVGAIDMGTNTFHLLIAEPVAGESPRMLERDKRFVKIGSGGISNGYLTEAAFERALGTLRQFSERLQHWQVSPERVFATATSAVRSAKNGGELVDRIKAETGIQVRVINGDQEAAYIYEGVRLALPLADEPSLIMDIGGGSVEFIIGNDARIFWKQSFEIGAQRLLDRFGQQDPLGPAAVQRLFDYLDEQLLPLHNAVHQYAPQTLVGSSGSFDTFCDIYYQENGLQAAEHQTEYELPLAVYRQIHQELLEKNREERLAIPGMIDMRVDMIVVASCLIQFVLSRYGLTRIRVSTFALKEGLLAAVLAGKMV
ncbi:exopolyphosphatase / guanosine-5'-triphosphate,3'-diphosphate pyrophosphatase [Catalinimonas alkaloidigena]|uniref:Exopolyphosphatase / guanosine-5'-triphosphate,3'-diphosphate pyrophosphatase n=1 Tax=Catalinimonas alkaloidigena TaxID=1075417 RepID=A0A1G9HK77_9BACT|nr:Ppx/GppA phosphatase family protein [Catalinimonas alkaloidigena]SDL12903.1 exopolyphosphatase / guanosine-5'-triphosphate,3'-diphosphate pyrophosphatase [Catalinimonas alkaloidigena]